MRRATLCVLVLLTLTTLPLPGRIARISGLHAPAAPPPAPDRTLADAYGRIPLYFEANRGQTDPQVKFLARGRGTTLFLTAKEAVMVLTPPQRQEMTWVVRMKLVGVKPSAALTGLDELPGKVNYFIGNDPRQWRTNIPTYAKVRSGVVYPGVDLVYYGTGRQLEYDFEVAPGADPSKITLGFEGVDRLEVAPGGDLLLHVAGGEIRQHRPRVYQEVDGVRRQIAGGYVRRGPHEFGFQVAAYDVSRPLIIDPVLTYSTYLGGSNIDNGFGIAVDSSGNAYVTGITLSTNFPTMNPVQAALAGGQDVFVTKLNAAGSALVYSTYLGGSGTDSGVGIAVDGSGAVYVTGFTTSTDFPTTANPFQRANGGSFDAFVARIYRGTAVGLYDPANGVWYERNSNSAGPADLTFVYGPGGMGWVPIVGDWDSNGTTTAGVYNPATGVFYLRNSNTAGPADVVFGYGPGGLGWIPEAGDWDGNGTVTPGLYDPSTGVWYLRNSNSAGVADLTFQYGAAGVFVPIVGDWDGNGTTTVGVYQASAATWQVRNSNMAGFPDLFFVYGPAGLG